VTLETHLFAGAQSITYGFRAPSAAQTTATLQPGKTMTSMNAVTYPETPRQRITPLTSQEKKKMLFFHTTPIKSQKTKGHLRWKLNSDGSEPRFSGGPIGFWTLLRRDPSHMFINISYANTHLHFKNFAPKLEFLAMLNSFTGRITTTLPVVVVIIIGVVVTVPV
jgi:hypothetical protein